MTRWRPIKTAPKDGREIIVCGDGSNSQVYVAAYWPSDAGIILVHQWRMSLRVIDGGSFQGPTRWMPLPPR